MNRKNKSSKFYVRLKMLMISIVIIFGIFIAIQLLKSSSISIFITAIITFLLSPSII